MHPRRNAEAVVRLGHTGCNGAGMRKHREHEAVVAHSVGRAGVWFDILPCHQQLRCGVLRCCEKGQKRRSCEKGPKYHQFQCRTSRTVVRLRAKSWLRAKPRRKAGPQYLEQRRTTRMTISVRSCPGNKAGRGFVCGQLWDGHPSLCETSPLCALVVVGGNCWCQLARTTWIALCSTCCRETERSRG